MLLVYICLLYGTFCASCVAPSSHLPFVALHHPVDGFVMVNVVGNFMPLELIEPANSDEKQGEQTYVYTYVYIYMQRAAVCRESRSTNCHQPVHTEASQIARVQVIHNTPPRRHTHAHTHNTTCKWHPKPTHSRSINVARLAAPSISSP